MQTKPLSTRLRLAGAILLGHADTRSRTLLSPAPAASRATAPGLRLSAVAPFPWALKKGHLQSEACPINVMDADGEEICAVVNDAPLTDDPTDTCRLIAEALKSVPELGRILQTILSLSPDDDGGTTAVAIPNEIWAEAEALLTRIGFR
jgi:hypothetical protein